MRVRRQDGILHGRILSSWRTLEDHQCYRRLQRSFRMGRHGTNPACRRNHGSRNIYRRDPSWSLRINHRGSTRPCPAWCQVTESPMRWLVTPEQAATQSAWDSSNIGYDHRCTNMIVTASSDSNDGRQTPAAPRLLHKDGQVVDATGLSDIALGARSPDTAAKYSNRRARAGTAGTPIKRPTSARDFMKPCCRQFTPKRPSSAPMCTIPSAAEAVSN